MQRENNGYILKRNKNGIYCIIVNESMLKVCANISNEHAEGVNTKNIIMEIQLKITQTFLPDPNEMQTL